MAGEVAYALVDVFAEQPGGGNPAGVVLAADALSAEEMQRVATALGVSDTAFVTGQGPHWEIRWFTPVSEVNLCGHATIAAAHLLAEHDDQPVELTYPDGRLTVRPQAIGGETIYWLSRRAPELAEPGGDVTPLLAALGQPRLDRELPARRTPEGDLLLPLWDVEAVTALQPDQAALKAACEDLGLRGVATLAIPGPGRFEVRARFFAPRLGVPEDPATGSVHGAIAVYLHEIDVFWSFPEELRAHSLQGAPEGRQGVLWLRLLRDEDLRPRRAEVGGQAVTVSRGSL